MRNVIIGLVAVGLLVLAYFWLMSDDETPQATGGPDECDPNNIGFQKNGIASAKCMGGNATPTPPAPLFNTGDNIYVPPIRGTYLYLYNYPQDNFISEVGRVTNALVGAGPMGKFVSMAGNGRFVKFSTTGLTIEKKVIPPARPSSYYYNIEPIVGEYYVLAEKVQNKPY